MSAVANRPDHAREIRHTLVDPIDVCDRLGLLGARGTFTRQAGGVIIRCPWHEDRTPSCSVRRGPDGTVAVRCHGCGETGDVFSLVAVVYGLNTRSDFRQVLATAARIGGLLGIADEIETGVQATVRPIVAPPRPLPERTYPLDAVGVWERAHDVTSDAETVAWLSSRGLDPELVAADDLARTLLVGGSLPRWASYQRTSWTETGHRLIVPMLDCQGVIRSVRGCRVTPGESPKRLPPGGHKATDLVMACPIGTAMLVGTATPAEVVIVEGEPDFLTWATRRTERPVARLGIVSGSWSFAMAQRIPRGAEVWIRTDHDAAGNRYAEALTKTLRWRGCFVRRGGRGDG